MGLLREIRLELSYAVFALGTVLSLFAVFEYFLRGALPLLVTDLLDAIGNWIVWFAALGPLLGFGGGWYFVDTLLKRREFERLIDVNSKARFVRNQERLERLAWYLPAAYEKRLLEQERRWKVRR